MSESAAERQGRLEGATENIRHEAGQDDLQHGKGAEIALTAPRFPRTLGEGGEDLQQVTINSTGKTAVVSCLVVSCAQQPHLSRQ